MFLQICIFIPLGFLSEFSKLAFSYLYCQLQHILQLLFIWVYYVWILECIALARTSNFDNFLRRTPETTLLHLHFYRSFKT